jgi:hypothetical protein
MDQCGVTTTFPAATIKTCKSKATGLIETGPSRGPLLIGGLPFARQSAGAASGRFLPFVFLIFICSERLLLGKADAHSRILKILYARGSFTLGSSHLAIISDKVRW